MLSYFRTCRHAASSRPLLVVVVVVLRTELSEQSVILDAPTSSDARRKIKNARVVAFVLLAVVVLLAIAITKMQAPQPFDRNGPSGGLEQAYLAAHRFADRRRGSFRPKVAHDQASAKSAEVFPGHRHAPRRIERTL